MYRGIQEIRFNIYVDKTIASGWRYGNRHIYECGHCGRLAEVLERATEPFYCRQCNQLISVSLLSKE